MENNSANSNKDFQHALVLLKENKFIEAKNCLLKVLESEECIQETLNILAKIYAHQGDLESSTIYLERLVEAFPNSLHYRNLLTNVYRRLAQWQKACDCYRDFIKRNSSIADAYFNHAFYLRKNGNFLESIENYIRSIELKIQNQEEVYLNIALIYSEDLRQESKAKEYLLKALEINPDYTAAMFNLANLLEQEGRKAESLGLFEEITKIDTKNFEALARIADLQKNNSENSNYVKRLLEAIKQPGIEQYVLTDLYFSLGKSLDDCHQFDKAFEFYSEGNRLNAQIQNKYSQRNMEDKIQEIKSFFNSQWFSNISPISQRKVTFICGMFRSGSTLTEQILAAHPQITAGGEREFFVRIEKQKLLPFPSKLENTSIEALLQIANEYVKELELAFPNAELITDKRPDNFIYLGLIKTLFPNAKIFHTKRNILDNCLSVYFQRLGNAMNYANDLLDIGHYYLQQESLMNHWKSMFGDSIFEVNYDDLVKSPNAIVRSMLEFLELPWNESCLNFHQNTNYVKTASVWQVRRPLYQSSSGRWSNYKEQVKDLSKYLNLHNLG